LQEGWPFQQYYILGLKRYYLTYDLIMLMKTGYSCVRDLAKFYKRTGSMSQSVKDQLGLDSTPEEIAGRMNLEYFPEVINYQATYRLVVKWHMWQYFILLYIL